MFGAPAVAVDVYVIDLTGGLEALALTHELRRAGVRADRSFDNRSMKAQFKGADRSGAPLAVIIGSDELADGTATLRDLRTGTQEPIARADILAAVNKRLA